MKVFKKITRKPLHVLKISKRKLRRSMLKVKAALSQEKTETKQMLKIYSHYVQGEAKPGEMQIANKQFMDILKGLGLGVFAVLPFSPITIPIIVKLGKTVGVDILPSAFAEQSSSSKKMAKTLKANEKSIHKPDDQAKLFVKPSQKTKD